jgi:hypothetical protein
MSNDLTTVTSQARHRPDYILERGIWRVTCRDCGWKATDPARRILASRFRFHVQTNEAEVNVSKEEEGLGKVEGA